MRKGTPNQFIHELMNKIDELKSEDVESSAVIVDDTEDVIEADENTAEELLVLPESESDADDSSYLDGLYSNVEEELYDIVDAVSWSGDEYNIYMDVNFTNGHVFTFTIPRDDLIYDLHNIDKDVNYICKAVREVDTAESTLEDLPENFSTDTLDSTLPAYL